MYIDEIEIKNYGCIEDFSYKFRKNKNEEPVSMIIVGKNGTGKTLLISNLIDSMVEIKRNLYPRGIQEVNGNNYYKVGNAAYIKIGKKTSKVYIKGIINNKNVEFIDIMSRNPQESLDNNEIDVKDLYNKGQFIENGYSKKININGLKAKEYEQELLLYFPSDKFYNPMWYNTENYIRINYDSDKFVGISNKNFIKIDVLNNIREWLTDIMMYPRTSEFFVKSLEDKNVKKIEINHTLKIQELIDKIFECIKGSGCNFTMPTRKNKRIGINGLNFNCNDISQLSTGEIFLIGIALSILKEWDLGNDNFELKDIKGCVIIDEVDIGMHIDYCYNKIPIIMNLFPNIQFIITTHSPFLLAGLDDSLKEKIDIVNMPSGDILNDISAFEEMKNVYKILESETKKVIDINEKLQKENQRLKNIDNKIIIYVEGKTDIKYLKIALNKLNGYEEIKNRIEYYDNENIDSNGDSELEKEYKYLQINNDNNVKICIFDRDNPRYIVQEKFVKGNNKVYKFNIPIPSNRSENDLISIEHYLKDSELKTKDINGRRLFLANEFSNERGLDIETHSFLCRYVINNSKKNGYHPLLILDGNDDKKVFSIDEKDKKNYALSKEDFVSNIENNIENFNNFDFSEFAKIFDIINEIRMDADND